MTIVDFKKNTGQPHDASSFLRAVNPVGPWHIVRIDPGKEKNNITGRCFDTIEKAANYIKQWNGRQNLYTYVNPVRAGFKGTKAAARDISHLRYLHVEIDPRSGYPLDEEQARIKEAFTGMPPGRLPKPTAVIFSGGGYWALWALNQPVAVDDPYEAKLYNKELERLYSGADSCHNIDRLIRIPFTWNIPDERKLAKGRKKAMSEVVYWSDASYEPSQFTKSKEAVSKRTRKEISSALHSVDLAAEKVTDIDALPLPEDAKIVMRYGTHPDGAREGQKDKTRSGYAYWFLRECARNDVTREQALGIVTDITWGISETFLEAGPKRAITNAIRQINNAYSSVSDDFDRDEKFRPLNTRDNYQRAIAELGHEVRFDKSSRTIEVDGEPITDGWRAKIATEIEREFKIDMGPAKARQAISAMAGENAYHPVLDYIDGLPDWDGEERLDKLFAPDGYVETDDPFAKFDHGRPLSLDRVNELYAAFGRITLLAAVRRALDPGCKVDTMPILMSKQGAFKSTMWQALCPYPKLFTDGASFGGPEKEFVEIAAGKWIIEIAEMAGNSQADIDKTKARLSRQVDRVRFAFREDAEDVPRQFILVATSNEYDPLRDRTGNRRSLPICVRKAHIDRIIADRDQIWAEALYLVKECDEPHWYDVNSDFGQDAKILQGAAKREHELRDILEDLFAGRGDSIAIRSRDMQVICQNMPGRPRKRDIKAAMEELGFEYKQSIRFSDGGTPAGFQKGDGMMEIRARLPEHDEQAEFGYILELAPRLTDKQAELFSA